MYLTSYGFFAIKNPDSLRSEKYNLSKMALERSITGDTLAGFSELDSDSVRPPSLEHHEPTEGHP